MNTVSTFGGKIYQKWKETAGKVTKTTEHNNRAGLKAQMLKVWKIKPVSVDVYLYK